MSNHPIHQKEFNCNCDHNSYQISLEKRNNDFSFSKEFTLRDILERWAGSEETLRTIMIAKTEEDRLKQEMVRLDIKRIENEILVNALRGGIQPNAIPTIFSGQLNNSTLALSQSYSLSSTSSVQYQSHNLGSSEISISALCHSSQEPGSLSNQCAPQPRHQTNIPNTLDSFPANSPSQKGGKSPFMLSRNVTEPAPNQNHTLNSNASSLPSLFFHYWIPPGESVNSVTTVNNEGSELTSQSNILNSHEKESCSFSPSKKKRVSQPQQLLLPPFGNSILPPLSKRSPRHHLRHRSETSVLQSKFFDIPSNKPGNSPTTNENSLPDPKILADKSSELKEKKYKDDKVFGI
ncbi:unnamed protein product [Pneumocystis jirovecii]|uniref:Uncharacterized protein n=2 Tax=Pneumocystis jirovecii TaxID=42068 RepID=L0PGL0_PNEJI|nr:uncharacterized protein T551_01020 [Pneumocystis jirovecii RU7]KTW31759.1 hypothetical protein T551_01020 [Pneumocystis jirovecii RU7]CCJ30780.1 unnamed protein product [Pneumocystis jirovecii]